MGRQGANESNQGGPRVDWEPLARLFSWAERVRYARRPAVPRAGGSKLGTAARQPMRINGAIKRIPIIIIIIKKLATRPQRCKFSPNEPDAKAILVNRREA